MHTHTHTHTHALGRRIFNICVFMKTLFMYHIYAGKAYGVEDASVSSIYATEPGTDYNFLLQKMKCIHGFASWALEHFPEEPLPAVITAPELLEYIAQAKVCSKAILALSGGGGGSGGDGEGGGGGGAAAADVAADAELVLVDSARLHGGDSDGIVTMSADIYQFAGQLIDDDAAAIASLAEGIVLLEQAATRHPDSADIHSSLAELYFDTGKVQTGSAAAKAALTAAAALYEKALDLEVDAVSAYNLACIHALLCNHVGGGDGDGGGERETSILRVQAAIEAAAAAAAAEKDGNDGDDGISSSLAELKEELREDPDLESLTGLQWFLDLTSS